MFWTTFVFTILATTDIFPPYLHTHFLVPYTIKAVPCILVWCTILIDLMRIKKNEHLVTKTQFLPV